MPRTGARRYRGRSSFLSLRVTAIFAVVAAAWLFASSEVAPAHDDAHLSPHGPAKTDRRLLESDFPDDLFSMDQKRSGAVVLHFIGMIYMFIGLAIICDLYFVSALEVIVEKYDIEDDVAGATFMAAGGSAPELFTSIIGTFIAKSDVGFSTIVGSAVFNVLFVIGICAVGAGQVLDLTWFPLTRDSICYTICLCVLVGVIEDQEVKLWEAFLMFALYIVYVWIMKYNVSIREWAMNLRKKPVSVTGGSPTPDSPGATDSGKTAGPCADATTVDVSDKRSEAKSGSSSARVELEGRKLEQRTFSEADHLNNAGKQRRGSLDGAVLSLTRPRSAGRIKGDESKKDEHHHAIKFQTMLDGDDDEPEPLSSSSPHSRPRTLPSIKSRPGSGITPRSPRGDFSVGSPRTPGRDPMGLVPPALPPKVPDPTAAGASGPGTGDDTVRVAGTGSSSSTNVAALGRGTSGWHVTDDGASAAPGTSPKASLVPVKTASKDDGGGGDGDDDDDDEPLIEPWPEKTHDRIWWCFKAPLMYLLAYTVPDCRGEGQKWFVATFILSILYIAVFSYGMVWMADVIGRTIGIPETVMGVTILAAGTSIPDALSSLIVARNGHGDMAVSSSIGSNIFDITVGLPIPWLLFYLVATWDSSRDGPVTINSDTLLLSVITLLGMLLATVLSIHCTGWKLDYRLGIVCIVLYFIFIAEVLILEYA